MKAKKIISKYAKTDLVEASTWYESQQKGLGKRFLDEIKKAFDTISLNPVGFQIWYDEYRIYYTKVFPYSIHYKYVVDTNTIRIEAVFHTARNPEIWERH